MVFRTSTSAIAVAVTATVMMVGAVQAADDAKYPDWKGAWTRWFPPGSTLEPNGGFTAGGQPSHDQTKPWGRGQEAPLTPEYQKIFEDSLADQANGGQGNFFDHAVRCMPGGMPLMTIGFGAMEFIVTPKTTYIEPGGGEPVESTPMGATGPRTSTPHRLTRATLSADGSMRTATASMTY